MSSSGAVHGQGAGCSSITSAQSSVTQHVPLRCCSAVALCLFNTSSHTPSVPPAALTLVPLQVQRNCVVLPCLHFLYCDTCVKQRCGANPSCPACNCAVTGFQTLLMHPSR